MGLQFDWTISVGTVLQLAAWLAGGAVLLWRLCARFDRIELRMGALEDGATEARGQIQKIYDHLIALARGGEGR